jgi:phage-related protein
MGRWLLGARRLHHGGRRQRGRRRGRFLRRDRIRYIRLSARTKARLPPPARGTPERRTAIHPVGHAMPRPPPRPRARRALRLQRSAPAAENLHLRATHAASKSSVHPKAALSRRGWTPGAFDGTVIHGRRVARCARHEGSGVQTRAFTYSETRTLRRRRPRWRRRCRTINVLGVRQNSAERDWRRHKHLRGDIYEVRADASTRSFRLLFAAEGSYSQVLLSLSVFEKRTQKTPPRELDLADGRLREWRHRGTARKKAVARPKRS